MLLRRRAVTAFVLLALVQVRVHAAMDVTAPPSFGGTGVERGVIVVRCATAVPDVARVSRGAVLDLDQGPRTGDVVLTTAHGLPETAEEILQQCRVHGAHGRAYRIAGVWRASSDGFGIAADWAVLLLERRLGGEVRRLPVARVAGERWSSLAATGAPVRVGLREVDAGEGDCRLRVLDKPYDYAPTDLMLYSCPESPNRSRAPGLSGSPVLVGVADHATVVGIHLGWGLLRLEDGRWHAVNIGRPIDAAIAVAIGSALAAARR